MNCDTGEIGMTGLTDEELQAFLAEQRGSSMRLFQSGEEMRKAGFTVPLKHPPNPNCIKCSGKGHPEERNGNGQFDPCSCTQ
jgi:hypothetical protein